MRKTILAAAALTAAGTITACGHSAGLPDHPTAAQVASVIHATGYRQDRPTPMLVTEQGEARYQGDQVTIDTYAADKTGPALVKLFKMMGGGHVVRGHGWIISGINTRAEALRIAGLTGGSEG